jgi:uncharacterized protein (TIGR02284 family)
VNAMDAIETKLLVATLNRCIEACVDAERAYGVAAATAREPSLKSFFRARFNERAEFVLELQRAAYDLGSWPENEGTTKGAMRRRWMDVTRGFEPLHDDHRVVASMIREEQAARDAYDTIPAARADEMPLEIRVMLREQRGAMELASDELARRFSFSLPLEAHAPST